MKYILRVATTVVVEADSLDRALQCVPGMDAELIEARAPEEQSLEPDSARHVLNSPQL